MATTQFESPKWGVILSERKHYEFFYVCLVKILTHSGIFDKECLQCIYNGRSKFWATQSSFGADANFHGKKALGLHFFVLNSKKSWSNKTKVWMPCHKSSNVHFQAKRKKKKEKIIIPYMSSMQVFFINIMSLFHKVFETVIVHCC